MKMVLWAWLAEVGIVTWRDIKQESRPPVPSELLATFVIFGALSVVGETKAEPAASAFAWGLVLATFMNFVDPTMTKKYPCSNQPKAAPKKNTSAQLPTGPILKGPY